jgi:hypothetical protein
VRGRYPRPLDDGTVAGGEGLEPSLTGPEPVVLPLNDPPAKGLIWSKLGEMSREKREFTAKNAKGADGRGHKVKEMG